MNESENKPLSPESEALFHRRLDEHRQWVDRMFLWLMPFQYVAGIVLALVVSPRAWSGTNSSVHPHVIAAVGIGGLITAWPVMMAWRYPGRALTRHVVAIGQFLMSALLIHLTGGRIETHFHVFGSLAFIAFYRDWRVLVTATVVTAVDHLIRGAVWPQSVYGVLAASNWRWLEHAGWVLFEDLFLLLYCRTSLREMRLMAGRQAELEQANDQITREMLERRRAETQREEAIRKAEVSRIAGMAEVATGVLHNVGNVLNSVNVSAGVIAETLRNSRTGNLGKATALLDENSTRLGEFLTRDERGRQLPGYLRDLAGLMAKEQSGMLEELKHLTRGIEHIKQVIQVQQRYAKCSNFVETVTPVSVVEDALRMNLVSFERHQITVERDIQDLPAMPLDAHKVLQILVNLVSNARRALKARPDGPKRIVIRVARVESTDGERLRFVVEDNGTGIAPEHLPRLFTQGFTTYSDGHGFGLHASANAAREMGGTLSAHSDGPGTGATFTLELPLVMQTTGASA